MKKFSRIFLWVSFGFMIGTFFTAYKLVPHIEKLTDLTQEFVMDSTNLIAHYQGTLMHTHFENALLNLKVLLMYVDDKDAVLNDLWQSTVQTVSNISEHVETSVEHDNTGFSITDRLQLVSILRWYRKSGHQIKSG